MTMQRFKDDKFGDYQHLLWMCIPVHFNRLQYERQELYITYVDKKKYIAKEYDDHTTYPPVIPCQGDEVMMRSPACRKHEDYKENSSYDLISFYRNVQHLIILKSTCL